jgi:alanine dehydrogenase
MGNIGNLNCAHTTHTTSGTSSPPDTPPSRIQRDLDKSIRKSSYMENKVGTEPLMLRRAVGRIPNVCIVGAGVAGLRCADVLLQHGAKVTILEGRDRVGGRVG